MNFDQGPYSVGPHAKGFGIFRDSETIATYETEVVAASEARERNRGYWLYTLAAERFSIHSRFEKWANDLVAAGSHSVTLRTLGDVAWIVGARVTLCIKTDEPPKADGPKTPKPKPKRPSAPKRGRK